MSWVNIYGVFTLSFNVAGNTGLLSSFSVSCLRSVSKIWHSAMRCLVSGALLHNLQLVLSKARCWDAKHACLIHIKWQLHYGKRVVITANRQGLGEPAHPEPMLFAHFSNRPKGNLIKELDVASQRSGMRTEDWFDGSPKTFFFLATRRNLS